MVYVTIIHAKPVNVIRNCGLWLLTNIPQSGGSVGLSVYCYDIVMIICPGQCCTNVPATGIALAFSLGAHLGVQVHVCVVGIKTTCSHKCKYIFFSELMKPV